jgi:hypothetical protein
MISWQRPELADLDLVATSRSIAQRLTESAICMARVCGPDGVLPNPSAPLLYRRASLLRWPDWAAVYVAATGGSHPFAKRVGAWPSVVAAAVVTVAAAEVVTRVGRPLAQGPAAPICGGARAGSKLPHRIPTTPGLEGRSPQKPTDRKFRVDFRTAMQADMDESFAIRMRQRYPPFVTPPRKPRRRN